MTKEPQDTTCISQAPVRPLTSDSAPADVDGAMQPDSGEGKKAGSAPPKGAPGGPVCSSVLPVEAIRIEVATKVRGHRNPEVVASYAHAMRDGIAFPPVVVYWDGATYWLADGAHRVAAAKKAALDLVDVEVREGTERDAFLYAASANIKHGLPTTIADRKRAATFLLGDPEWGRGSSREIGRRCGLHGKTVEKLRGETSAERPQMRKVTRRGMTYEMATRERNGRRSQEAEAVASASEVIEESEGDREGGDVVGVADGPETPPTSCPVQPAGQGGFSAIVIASNPRSKGETQILGRALAKNEGPDTVLWMWTATRQLPQALSALRRWGFKYAGLLTWVKGTRGNNDHMTANAQHCVVAVRGTVSLTISSHALWQRGATDLDQLRPFYGLVEKLCPGTKVQLFTERRRKGWTSFSYETGGEKWQEVGFDDSEARAAKAQIVGV